MCNADQHSVTPRSIDDYYREMRRRSDRHFLAVGKPGGGGTSYMQYKLMIHMPDRVLISEKYTIDSFIKFLTSVGFQKVADLGLTYKNRFGKDFPVVLHQPARQPRAYKQANGGWWALSNCPTVVVGQLVNEIADRLNLRAYAELASK